MPFSERAPAKINLFLHITGKRPDGYHVLESAVAFTQLGDVLHAEPANALTLDITGPFAIALAKEEVHNNLALKAAILLREASEYSGGARITLEKHLPVGAGMGGGSADAAATLRLLCRLWNVPFSVAQQVAQSGALGSDVHACLHSRALVMRGIGEELQPLPLPQPLHLVLVNPGVPLSTPAVYGKLLPPYRAALPDFVWQGNVAVQLASMHNDLTAPARVLMPEIADVLQALNEQKSCMLARMSGSGATCFGIFPDAALAQAAADDINARHPHWWVRHTQTMDRNDAYETQ